MVRPFPVGVRLEAGAFAQVARSTPLRRAQLSFGLIWASEWALLVGLGVYAFRNGGAAAVGAVTAVRMIPAALMAPFAATVADVVRRELILVWIGVVRAATLGAAAVLLATGELDRPGVRPRDRGDDRADAVPARALRAAARALHVAAAADERERGARHARLDRGARRSARRDGAAGDERS